MSNKPSVACEPCGGEGLVGRSDSIMASEDGDWTCDGCGGSGRVELPCKFEVCPQCEGHGTSSAYLGAFTGSEWAEQDDDFKEDYLAGRYDRQCETCKGLRVVPVVDEDRCDPKLLAEYRREQEENAADMRTMRMESGWGYDSGHGF